jgi:DNA-binding response OmpR family regulator
LRQRLRKALIVEDESNARDLLRFHLESRGFEVDEALDGEGALTRLGAKAYDLVVLDLRLPKLDGVSVCKAMRAAGPNTDTPILMVTARGEEADKVTGLESGADDYLAKPFGVQEFLARVGALLRRHHREHRAEDTPARDVTARGIYLDAVRRRAVVRGRVTMLTRQEFDLLFRLMSHRGRVFTRASLLESVWRDDRFVTDRTVDTLVSRLRRKIEHDPEHPTLITTAWGVGYQFVDDD